MTAKREAHAVRLLVGVLLAGAWAGCCAEEPAASPAPPQPGTGANEIRVVACELANGVLLDATGRDAAWARAAMLPALRLGLDCAGEPAMASRAAAFRAGRWLIFGLEADETDALVARHVVHGESLWREDAFIVDIGDVGRLRLMANPLGAICCYRAGRRTMGPIAAGTVRAAARVEPGRWRVELAVDLRDLPAEARAGRLVCRVRRQRQQRGLVPFEETAWPPAGRPPGVLVIDGAWPPGPDVPLDVAPAQRLAARAVLEAGRADPLPAADRQWQAMPARLLAGEDGRAALDGAFQATEVRAATCGDRLALWIRCDEAHPAAIVDAGRALWQADSLEIFLGPEGYNYLQLMTNPRGVLKAARGRTGGRGVREIDPPEGVRVRSVSPTKDAWVVQVTVPYRAVAERVGAPAGLVPAAHPWRVQVVRNRPAREALGEAAQASVLSVTGSGTAHCPARFGRLRIVEPSGEPVAAPTRPKPGLPPPVLSPADRKRLAAAGLVGRWIDSRSTAAAAAWEEEFRRVRDAAGWRAYAGRLRTNLARSLFPATAGRMPPRGGLDGRIVYDLPGKGFRCRGVIFASFPGLPMPATLYVPAGPAGRRRPALLMVPAHHTGRNSRDLAILGANFARAGGVAMAVESVGSGERAVAAPWAHKNHQRSLIGRQVLLAGDNPAGWHAFELTRAVDYLLTRGDVDGGRIAIVGGVAGGGDAVAPAAALDDRIAAAVPFNFSTAEPMDAWYDPIRSLHGARAGGLTPWAVCALIAPRGLVQAQEFAWTDREQQRYARFVRVYGWLGAAGRLGRLHGGPNTHATHFAAVHRAGIYDHLARWFRMKLPAGGEESTATIDPGRLDCFETPRGRSYLARRRGAGELLAPHELTRRIARDRLAAARAACRREARREGCSLADAIARRLERLLGRTAPAPAAARARPVPLGHWRGAAVQGVYLPAEGAADPPGLAAWLLLPRRAGRLPAVLGVCQSGKARFLAERGRDVAELLAAGVAVCLLDVRACGESRPGTSRLPDGPSADLAYGLWALGDSLPVRQLKDVRTALAWLAAREQIDPARLALWGEGLARANAPPDRSPRFEETGFRQATPVSKHLAEPLGGMLAMLAALWPVEGETAAHPIRAVLARGTLVSWLSVLQRRHHYVPADAIVPGLLRVADMPAVAEALRDAGVRLHAEDLRDGANRTVLAAQLRSAWGPAAPAHYAAQPTPAAARALLESLADASAPSHL